MAAALAPADLTINGPTSVTVGQTAQYTAYSNGTRLTTGVWWYVQDSPGAAIDHATGVLTAVAAGSATVRFDYVTGGVNTSSTPYPISIQTSGTPPGTSTLSISGPTSVTVGSTAQYTAKAGSQTLTSGVWWYLSEGTATIDHSTGILTGVSSGPATVRFDYVQGGVPQGKAAYPISIQTSGTPTGTLSVSGPTSVTVGSTAQYTAKAGSQTLTSGVWWYLSEGTATIDHSTGILTGVSSGPATVRFDYVQGGVPQGKAAYPITINPTTAPPTTAPRLVVFTASTDHATNVTSYLLEVFAAGANPNTATPVATSDLGKPTPAANSDITVDRSAFFSGLASGSYVTTVSAIGPGGRTRSASVTFTR